MVGARPRSAELGSSRASRASLCSAQGIFEKAKLPQKWIGIPSGHCSSPAGNIRIVLCSMTLYCKNSSSSSLASKFYTCKGKICSSETRFHALRPSLTPLGVVSGRPLGGKAGGRAVLVPTREKPSGLQACRGITMRLPCRPLWGRWSRAERSPGPEGVIPARPRKYTPRTSVLGVWR